MARPRCCARTRRPGRARRRTVSRCDATDGEPGRDAACRALLRSPSRARQPAEGRERAPRRASELGQGRRPRRARSGRRRSRRPTRRRSEGAAWSRDVGQMLAKGAVTFSRGARYAAPTLVDGSVGLVVGRRTRAPGREPGRRAAPRARLNVYVVSPRAGRGVRSTYGFGKRKASLPRRHRGIGRHACIDRVDERVRGRRPGVPRRG